MVRVHTRTGVGAMAVMATVALVTALAAPAPAAETVRIGTGRTWNTPGIFIGKALGLFSTSQFGVEILEFPTPPAVLEAMVAGAVDVGTVPQPNFLVAREKGLPIVAVAAAAADSTPAQFGFLVRKDAGIKSVRDLKGKTIGINNYGGTFDMFLNLMLEKAGLDPKRDVTLTIVPLPTILDAIAKGTIDAGNTVPLLTLAAEARHPGKLQVLFDTHDIPEIEGGRNYNSMIVVMSRKFLQEKREVARAFLRQYQQAIRQAKADPKKAVEVWAKEVNLPLLSGMTKFHDFPEDAHIFLPGVAMDIQLLTKYGHLKKPAKAEEVVDSSLLK